MLVIYTCEEEHMSKEAAVKHPRSIMIFFMTSLLMT